MSRKQTQKWEEYIFIDKLFQTFHPLIQRTVQSCSPEEALWEDILQESLARLLTCAPALRRLPEEKLAGCIFRTTRSAAEQFLKQEGGSYDTKRRTLGKL